jgi:hypothetical protein
MIKMWKFLKINYKDDKKIRTVKKNTVNKYMADIRPVKSEREVGRKSTTKCTLWCFAKCQSAILSVPLSNDILI